MNETPPLQEAFHAVRILRQCVCRKRLNADVHGHRTVDGFIAAYADRRDSTMRQSAKRRSGHAPSLLERFDSGVVSRASAAMRS